MARDVALALCLLFVPLAAHAEPQLSVRLGTGAGVYQHGAATDARFDLHLSADVLFGDPFPNRVRLGPLLDLRTGDFTSFEIAGGMTVLLPVVDGFPLLLSAGGGYAARDRGAGAVGFGRVAFGYRDYSYSLYGWCAAVYVDTRVSIDRWEVVGGVEIDVALLAAPFLALVTALRGHP